jgi:hypothetical protein
MTMVMLAPTAVHAEDMKTYESMFDNPKVSEDITEDGPQSNVDSNISEVSNGRKPTSAVAGILGAVAGAVGGFLGARFLLEKMNLKHYQLFINAPAPQQVSQIEDYLTHGVANEEQMLQFLLIVKTTLNHDSSGLDELIAACKPSSNNTYPKASDLKGSIILVNELLDTSNDMYLFILEYELIIHPDESICSALVRDFRKPYMLSYFLHILQTLSTCYNNNFFFLSNNSWCLDDSTDIRHINK